MCGTDQAKRSWGRYVIGFAIRSRLISDVTYRYFKNQDRPGFSQMRTVRIFVSSPNDALDERRRVSRVVERLNGAFRDSVQLEAVRWEERYYSAHDGYQPQIPRSSECDIVLAILRGRLGSPLSAEFHAGLPPEERPPAGMPYPSGTAYEIVSAIKSRQRGGELPDIYVFRWPSPPQVSLDAPDRVEVEAQWSALKRFADDVFVTPEGHFKGAYQTYASLDDFEAQTEALMRDWLETHVLGDRAVLWPAEKGSPFRGLEPFGMRHAEVFFGRTQETTRAVGKLELSAQHGTPFQLVVGPSGAGKSSFVRAGLVPKLIAPGEIAGVSAWRVALMRPGESPEGPVAALAQRLFDTASQMEAAEVGRPEALPELREGAFATPEALGRLLLHADETSTAPLLAALACVAAKEHERWSTEQLQPARLLLVVDQLDEIFATAITDEQRLVFARLLEALGRSGAVWTVATLRAEFYEVFLKSPLAGLAGDDRTLILKPPGLAEMAEIVREPARAAGLSWEADPASGERLDERLLAEIDRPDLLPLLQFVLDRLYEKREGGGSQPLRLTISAYRALGTLDGAIRAEAERAYVSLGSAEQASLPRLLRGLITPAHVAVTALTEKTAFALSPALLDVVAPSPAARRLAEALINARILVTGRGSNGMPTIALAHQRVIEAWDRAKTIVADSVTFHRVRDGIITRRHDWEGAKRPNELLLPRGVLLAQAEDLVATYNKEIEDVDITFVQASRRHTNRALRRAYALTGLFAFVALSAVVAGWIAYRQTLNAEAAQQVAQAETKRAEQQTQYAREGATEVERQKIEAELQRAVAEKQSLEAKRNQSAALTALSSVILVTDPTQALKLALASWPRSAQDLSPKLDITLTALSAAMQLNRDRTLYQGHALNLTMVAFSPDRGYVLTASEDTTARIWDTSTGREIQVLRGHKGSVVSAVFSADGSTVLTASKDTTARIWEVSTGREIKVLSGHSESISSAVFSPDGASILTSSWDLTSRLWDASTGRTLQIYNGHTSGVRNAIFSPDGKRILTTSNDATARIWDTFSGREIKTIRKHTILTTAVFSPDGTRVLTSGDKTPRLWDAITGREIQAFNGHTHVVRNATFSDDGSIILTASLDDTARIWDPSNGQLIRTFKKNTIDDVTDNAGLIDAIFVPLSTKLITIYSNGTIYVWDYLTGEKLYSLKGIDVKVSNDGARVLTIQDKNAHLWDIETGSNIWTAEGGNVAFSASRTLFFTSSIDKGAQIWDLKSRRIVKTLNGVIGNVLDAVFSPDDTKILTTSRDSVNLWDVKSGNKIRVFKGAAATVWMSRFSPDGSRVISASEDHTVQQWDAATGKQLLSLIGHTDQLTSAIFSPGGGQILTASKDQTARIWDATTGRQTFTLAGHAGAVTGALFSPDGTRIVTASDDKTTRIWDVATGDTLKVLRGHTDNVNCAIFSPDGTRVLTASDDRTAALWDAVSGQKIRMFKGHTDRIVDAAFSTDGTRIVTSSGDKTALLWDTATGGMLQTFRGHTDVLLNANFSSDNNFILTSSGDDTTRLWEIAALKDGNIFQISCRLLVNHDLSGLVENYGLNYIRPICIDDIPLPD
jgi:WD40 repeat protein